MTARGSSSVTAAGCALVLLVVASAGAFGHGDYAWIERGKYKSPKWGVDCCGPEDCHRIPAASVQKVPGGYKIGYHTYPWREILPSEDENYWGCGDAAEGYRCLFVPVGA